MSEWSGERLETFIFNSTTVEHLHRYALAKEFVSGKIVLDIACGEGYGASLFAQTARFVTGIDIEQEIVLDAKEKYTSTNLNFIRGSVEQIPCANETFDIVVSFETLEHIENHDQMMMEIKRVLKKDGILIVSTPNKLYYTDQRRYTNPFHRKELYKNDFQILINRFFKHAVFVDQCFGSSIMISENNCEFVNYRGSFASIEALQFGPHYILAVASDQKPGKIRSSIFDGGDVIERAARETESVVRNTITYQIGHILLYPLKKLKSLFKRKHS